MAKQIRVLGLFDYQARTGFGTVTKNVIKEIKKSFGGKLKLDIIAINYFGPPYSEDENTTVTSAKLNDYKEDDYGRNYFLKTLSEIDYDGVFIIQDLGMICPIIELINYVKDIKKEKNKKLFKTIFYFPVDCSLIYELTKDIENIDGTLVTYTEFAKKEVLKLKPNLKIKVLNHGNNFKEFYPLPKDEIEKFRKEYFGDDEKFIITNVNRNQPRKDIPNTIFGFIEARKIWDNSLPKPFLYLHCHPKDPYGWDLRAIMLQTDLEEGIDYKLLPAKYEESMAEIDLLNKIYNASDVYLTTTLGEGWGLGFSEAASCKIPIIAPYYSSFIEMSGYGKNAFMLETLYPFCSTFDNVIRQQTDIFEIAEKLVEVAKMKKNNDKELFDKLENNYNWAKKLDWSEICKKWVEIFKETFKI